MEPYAASPDVTILPTYLPVRGVGVLPVHSFVVAGREPLLIDTGVTLRAGEFVEALGTAIDPADLRWIWITHTDRDHTGALTEVLAAAPDARVITNYLGFATMGASESPIPVHRVYLMNPGQSIDIGGRTFVAVRPPLFDNPSTMVAFDTSTRTLFSADCFGGLLPTMDDARAHDAAEVADDDLDAAITLFGTIDSPWVHSVDAARFSAALASLQALGADQILSAHLPPIRRDIDRHIATLAALPSATPFVGPDQAALEAMLATPRSVTVPAPTEG